MILQETIDKVYGLSISEVIGSYVQLKKVGSSLRGLSPFTNEKTPSLMVSESKGIFKCFSSGKGGNLVSFIMEHEHCSFPEAIKLLCGKYGIPFIETAKSNEEKELELRKESIYILNSFATRFYQNQLKNNLPAFQYVIKEREQTPEILEKFMIGFADNSFTSLASNIMANNYDWKLAVECSLISLSGNGNNLYDRFRSRIIFPIKNHNGSIVGFGGRYIGKNTEQAKYLNSSDSIVYNKSNILYGLFEAKKSIVSLDRCYLVEGYLDVTSFHGKGIENTVSPCGTALTPEQAKLIRRFTSNVTIIFDSDAPGIKSTIRSVDVLLHEGINVSVCLLPKNEDPDSFSKNKSNTEILNYIDVNSKDFLLFKLNYLYSNCGDDFSKKSSAVTEIVTSISRIPNPIQREIYLKECSRFTEININSLREMMLSQNKEIESFDGVPELEVKYSVSKIHIKEQCEKKIIQYLLCYGSMTLPFNNIYIDSDSIVQEEKIVLNKILEDTIKEGIDFTNIIYSTIFDVIVKENDTSIELLKMKLSPELSLLIDNLILEENVSMNNSFILNESEEKKALIVESLQQKLSHSIHETLIFNKILFVSEMIEEKMKEAEFDKEGIAELLEFNHRLKHSLNLI